MNSLTPAQKRIVALVIIALAGGLQLLLLITALATAIEGTEDTLTNTLSFLFVVALLAFPLFYAVRLWRQGNLEREFAKVSIDPDTHFRFSTKISVEDYRKLVLYMTFTHPTIMFMYVLGTMMLLGFFLTPASDPMGWWPMFIVFFLLYLPFSVLRRAKSNYKTTKALHETATYEITSSVVNATGESYNTTMQWQTFYKARETKGWFLLYCNKQTALLIPKNVFASSTEIVRFRELAFKSIVLK